jgi:hypothetical protein
MRSGWRFWAERCSAIRGGTTNRHLTLALSPIDAERGIKGRIAKSEANDEARVNLKNENNPKIEAAQDGIGTDRGVS